jgi:hypothetical protein
MSAERAVQDAIYSALTGNAPYMALARAVYDEGNVPQGAPYPYTVIGATTEADEGSISGAGWALTFTLHDWTRYAGKRTCQQIMEARDVVLHLKELVVSGFNRVAVRREFSEIVSDRDEKGALAHAVSRYRVLAWPS